MLLQNKLAYKGGSPGIVKKGSPWLKEVHFVNMLFKDNQGALRDKDSHGSPSTQPPQKN